MGGFGHPAVWRQGAAVSACVVVNAVVTSALAAIVPVFLTTDLGASYFEASLLMVCGALATSLAVYVLGRFGDVPQRRFIIAVIAALCGLTGALLLTSLTGYWAILLVFSSLMAISGSLFPQLLALAFVYVRPLTPIIRAIASGGWVIGPPLGGLIVTLNSPASLFYSIAAAYVFLIVLLWAMSSWFSEPPGHSGKPNNPDTEAEGLPQKSIRPVIAVLSATHFLLAISALGIPWRIVQLGGTEYEVGLAFAVAAAIEIPIIAFSNIIIRRAGYRKLLQFCIVIIALYFVTIANIQSIEGIIVANILNGIATGIMMGLSLQILQEGLPTRPGYASSIYSNMLRLSYVAALFAAGGIAEAISIISIFWIAAGLTLCLGLGLVIWQPLGATMSRDG